MHDMDMRFDDKMTATIDSLQDACNLNSRGEVIRRAIALLKVCSEGVARGERLYLITADTRKEIVI